MRTILFNLPVFVFFDAKGNVISYRHHECENLLGPLADFSSTVHSFDPSIPNSHSVKPSRYEIPIALKIDENEHILSIDLSPVELVYGKTHNEILQMQGKTASF